MPVLINEFEAVAEPSGEQRPYSAAASPPRRLTPTELRGPLNFLALRSARVRAH
jgi:hypothetical protein